MQTFPTYIEFILAAIPVVFAITLHEVGHGWVAKLLGDNTAEQQGRLTVNPISHVDPIGTIAVPSLLFFTAGFLFGWAKPVPVNWMKLNKPKRDMALVALAGPAANLLMIIFWILLAKLVMLTFSEQSVVFQAMLIVLKWGFLINAILLLFNLLPMPPLDGSRVVMSILPTKLAVPYAKLEAYGLIIIVVLLATGVLSKILQPMLMYFERLILYIFF